MIERQLAFAGKVINEDKKKHALLNGLRQEYQINKTILQESYETSFEKMVPSLEQTEDELGFTGKGSGPNPTSGSVFMSGRHSDKKKRKSWESELPRHLMTDYYLNKK